MYVLCFTRPRYQVSVYRTIGPLVYLFSDNCYVRTSYREIEDKCFNMGEFLLLLFSGKSCLNMIFLNTALTLSQISYKWAYKCHWPAIHNDRSMMAKHL